MTFILACWNEKYLVPLSSKKSRMVLPLRYMLDLRKSIPELSKSVGKAWSHEGDILCEISMSELEVKQFVRKYNGKFPSLPVMGDEIVACRFSYNGTSLIDMW